MLSLRRETALKTGLETYFWLLTFFGDAGKQPHTFLNSQGFLGELDPQKARHNGAMLLNLTKR